MPTPEGRVKAAINRLLDKYKGVYRFMPVPGGFGASSLDYIVCYRGRFLSIEAKKPGGKMTDRQKYTADKIRTAGGAVFLIDGEQGLKQLQEYLENLDASHPRLSEAQDDSGAGDDAGEEPVPVSGRG